MLCWNMRNMIRVMFMTVSYGQYELALGDGITEATSQDEALENEFGIIEWGQTHVGYNSTSRQAPKWGEGIAGWFNASFDFATASYTNPGDIREVGLFYRGKLYQPDGTIKSERLLLARRVVDLATPAKWTITDVTNHVTGWIQDSFKFVNDNTHKFVPFNLKENPATAEFFINTLTFDDGDSDREYLGEGKWSITTTGLSTTTVPWSTQSVNANTTGTSIGWIRENADGTFSIGGRYDQVASKTSTFSLRALLFRSNGFYGTIGINTTGFADATRATVNHQALVAGGDVVIDYEVVIGESTTKNTVTYETNPAVYTISPRVFKTYALGPTFPGNTVAYTSPSGVLDATVNFTIPPNGRSCFSFYNTRGYANTYYVTDLNGNIIRNKARVSKTSYAYIYDLPPGDYLLNITDDGNSRPSISNAYTYFSDPEFPLATREWNHRTRPAIGKLITSGTGTVEIWDEGKWSPLDTSKVYKLMYGNITIDSTLDFTYTPFNAINNNNIDRDEMLYRVGEGNNYRARIPLTPAPIKPINKLIQEDVTLNVSNQVIPFTPAATAEPNGFWVNTTTVSRNYWSVTYPVPKDSVASFYFENAINRAVNVKIYKGGVSEANLIHEQELTTTLLSGRKFFMENIEGGSTYTLYFTALGTTTESDKRPKFKNVKLEAIHNINYGINGVDKTFTHDMFVEGTHPDTHWIILDPNVAPIDLRETTDIVSRSYELGTLLINTETNQLNFIPDTSVLYNGTRIVEYEYVIHGKDDDSEHRVHLMITLSGNEVDLERFNYVSVVQPEPLVRKESVQMEYLVNPASYVPKNVVWSVTSPYGTITPEGVFSCDVGGISCTVQVNVDGKVDSKPIDILPIAPQSISIVEDSVSRDKPAFLSLEILPTDADSLESDIIWELIDPSLGSFEGSFLTVTSDEITSIDVRATLYGVVAVKTLNVIQPVHTVLVKTDPLKVEDNSDINLMYRTLPELAEDDGTGTWAITTLDGVTVDATGLVSLNNVAGHTVNYTYTLNGVVGSGSFFVNPVLATNLELPLDLVLVSGVETNLTATVLPTRTSDKTVNYSADVSKATLSGNNITVIDTTIDSIDITMACGELVVVQTVPVTHPEPEPVPEPEPEEPPAP